MAALKASSFTPLHQRPLTSVGLPTTVVFPRPILHHPSFHANKTSFKVLTAVSPTVPSLSSDQEVNSQKGDEKFDWYAHWYPVAPICDLDKGRPHGKTILGIDLVIWYDRNEDAWKVFDDSCPHRLAPLSEGRIDQWGRLQCVYHGWCFGGAGDCKLIPQAPRDGPPIHTSKKACASVYPSCVQSGIVWFWPNSDPEYRDILLKKQPHVIPELHDPTHTDGMFCKEIPYGYDVLIENLMDPAHVPYAHYGIMPFPKTPDRYADREGGLPINKTIEKVDINGYTATQDPISNYFIAPCIFYTHYVAGANQIGESTMIPETKNETHTQKVALLIFYCVPVSPGKSRLIIAIRRNFAVWQQAIPRWIYHIFQNLIIDSDQYLLHVEERKMKDAGLANWNKVCYVPTKSDSLVVAFRKWLNKYGGTQVDWRGKFSGELPPTPPREQFFDRYWSHTVNCSSCNGAYKTLNAVGEVVLPVLSICLIGVAAAAKQSTLSVAARYGLVSVAVLCFIASKRMAHLVNKTFRYHDYDHALK